MWRNDDGTYQNICTLCQAASSGDLRLSEKHSLIFFPLQMHRSPALLNDTSLRCCVADNVSSSANIVYRTHHCVCFSQLEFSSISRMGHQRVGDVPGVGYSICVLPTAANPTRGYYVNLYLDYGRCETTVTDFRQLVGNLYYYNNNIQAA